MQHHRRPQMITTVFLVFALMAGNAWAQQTPPAAKPSKPLRVTSIRFSLSSGMCYGYCYSELKIDPARATLLDSSWDKDKSKCPDLTVKFDISGKRWKELTELIDRDTLFTLPKTIGCPGCADEEIESIEVQFSDRTSKAVTYNSGASPSEIKELSAKLLALMNKLARELPRTRCVM